MSYKYSSIFYIYIRRYMDILKIIQEYMKCYKENCKDDFDNIDKDKKLQIIKNKLKKNKNLKEIDKIVCI